MEFNIHPEHRNQTHAIVEKLEKFYEENRNLVVQEDGLICTPLHVIKSLAVENNTPIHTEVLAFEDCGEKDSDAVYRVEFFIGTMRGIGQSPRRTLSYQIAAMDMLEKIKSANPSMKLPPYGMIPGCRISPKVCRHLEMLVRRMGLPFPVYKGLPTDHSGENPAQTVICTVGDIQFEGRSDSHFVAKRLAAKLMFEHLSEFKYPNEVVCAGNECTGVTELESFGVIISSSDAKIKWMNEHRTSENKTFRYEDEPDDGDFHDVTLLASTESVVLPSKDRPTGITRTVVNNVAVEDMDGEDWA